MSGPYTLFFPSEAGRLARIEDIHERPFGPEKVKNINGDYVSLSINNRSYNLFLDGYGRYMAKAHSTGEYTDFIYVCYACCVDAEMNPSTTQATIYFINNLTPTTSIASLLSVTYEYNTAKGPFGDGRENPFKSGYLEPINLND